MEQMSKLIYYLDYFLPREVMGPVVIVFSAEHIIEILFERHLSQFPELYGWTGVFIVSVVAIAVWGEADEDMEEFEEKMEGME